MRTRARKNRIHLMCKIACYGYNNKKDIAKALDITECMV